MKISERLNDIAAEMQRSSKDRQLADVLREKSARLSPLLPRGSLERVANVVLDRLCEAGFDQSTRLELNPNFLLRLSQTDSISARKLAAKLLPEKFLRKMISDENASVRYEVANRCSESVLRDMMFEDEDDDNLQSIFSERFNKDKVDNTARIKKISVVANDGLYNRDAEFSDTWYLNMALKFIQDYGQNLEGGWEGAIVHRYCDSLRSLYGVSVDPEKMLTAIEDIEHEREREELEKYSLSELAKNLGKQVLLEAQEEIDKSEDEESKDPIRQLMSDSRDSSSEQYVHQAATVFDVHEASVPKALVRSSDARKTTLVPVSGRLPRGKRFDETTERALDRFTACWTECVNRAGQSIELRWSPEARDSNKICFEVVPRWK